MTSAVFGWLFPSVLPSGQMGRGVTTTAFAFSSLLTIPVFDRMWVYALSIAVAFVMAMVWTVSVGYRTPARATKTQMVAACKDRYGIVPVDDNAADACHLFYYYIRRHRL